MPMNRIAILEGYGTTPMFDPDDVYDAPVTARPRAPYTPLGPSSILDSLRYSPVPVKPKRRCLKGCQKRKKAQKVCAKKHRMLSRPYFACVRRKLNPRRRSR